MARRKITAFTHDGQTATVYKDAEWQEYIVKLAGRPQADYHTDDKEDAVATAKTMIGLSSTLHGFGMARRKKPSDKLRDQEDPEVLGYKLDRETLTPKKEYIDRNAAGDWGRDPIGNGLFRMVPSGDVVDYEESERRLRKKPLGGYGKVDVTRNFRRERKRSPSSCAAGSFRARKTRNGALLTFCCPKGKFNKRTGTCRVGMVMQSIGRPRRHRR